MFFLSYHCQSGAHFNSSLKSQLALNTCVNQCCIWKRDLCCWCCRDSWYKNCYGHHQCHWKWRLCCILHTFQNESKTTEEKNPLKFRDGLTKLYEFHQLCRMCFWRDTETPGYTTHGDGEKPQRESVWAVSDGAELWIKLHFIVFEKQSKVRNKGLTVNLDPDTSISVI